MRPAGVRGDVAADLRLLGRARVGREQQAALAREPPDVAGRHARLDVHPPEQRLERAHARQPLEGEHDPAAERDGPAGQPVPPPRGTIGDAALVAPGQHRGDLLRAPGQTTASARPCNPRTSVESFRYTAAVPPTTEVMTANSCIRVIGEL